MKNKELLSRIESKIGVSEGTAIFILSTLIIKIMGAVYKIPLCNLLGSKGVGLYQMVFPVYSLCITIACGGLPTAMTQIIAKGYNAENLLKKCLKSFLAIAIVLSLAIVVFSNKIALAQGDNSARLLYFAIAPAILFVSVICCFRGYFQGKGNFKPTAFSQMIEQVVKCVFGVIALLLVKRNIIIRTLFACFAITFSEIIALVYLALKYKKYRKKTLENNLNTKISFKQLFIIIAPITFALLFFPLASFIDSFIVVNALKNSYFERATEVYGIYAGGVETIIALPVALLHNLSLGYLPTLTKNNGGIKALAFTFILSVVCAIAVIVFSPFAVKLFFGGIKEYSGLLTTLLRYASINVIALSTLQATNCYLVAISKQKTLLFSMPVGVLVKIVVNLTLVKIPRINVFGMIISDFGCYFVALLINLLYIIYINKKVGKSNENYLNRSWRNKERFRTKCN